MAKNVSLGYVFIIMRLLFVKAKNLASYILFCRILLKRKEYVFITGEASILRTFKHMGKKSVQQQYLVPLFHAVGNSACSVTLLFALRPGRKKGHIWGLWKSKRAIQAKENHQKTFDTGLWLIENPFRTFVRIFVILTIF